MNLDGKPISGKSSLLESSGNCSPTVNGSNADFTKKPTIQCLDSIDVVKTLSKEEQEIMARYTRKVDIRMVFYCAIGFGLCVMDRANIGTAKISGLMEDLELTDTTYSVAMSLFYIGYLIMQPFSNVILKAIGPSIWLPFLGIAWGAMCMCQAAVKNSGGLVAVRVFLGIFTAGLSPGVVYLISFWYPRSKAGSRMGYFFLSNPIASVISGPLAAGLSHIPETTGLKRWQWIFIIEGLIAVLWGIGAIFLIQDYPEKCKFLTKQEQNVIAKVLAMENSLGSESKITRYNIGLGAYDWKTWLWGAISFASIFSIDVNELFAPSLIKSMGHESFKAQCMMAIPSAFGAMAMLLGIYLPKLMRGLTQAKLFYNIFTVAGSLILLFTANNIAKFAGLCIISMGGYGNLAIDPGWFMANTGGVVKRGIVSGIIVCFASFAGFAVSYVYPNKDAPRYVTGHSVNLALAIFIIIGTLFFRWWYSNQNKKKTSNPMDISHLSEKEKDELCDDHPDFRYIY